MMSIFQDVNTTVMTLEPMRNGNCGLCRCLAQAYDFETYLLNVNSYFDIRISAVYPLCINNSYVLLCIQNVQLYH